MKKTGSEIIVKLLEMEGISVAAGIPGGSILPLYNALAKSSIRHVLVRHEQAAGFIAQGMARSTGKAAVCFATSGPGAMNLLTAVADARSDSVPIVAITGQVNTSLIGTDAFQEADTFGLSFPIAKHSIMVKSPKLLRSQETVDRDRFSSTCLATYRLLHANSIHGRISHPLRYMTFAFTHRRPNMLRAWNA